MISRRSFLALVLALPGVVTAVQYGLVKEYAGTNFFNGWDFYGNCEWPMTIIPFSRILSLNEQTQLTTSQTAMRCTCGAAKSAGRVPLYLPSFADLVHA
jgi:hypothetical protein